MEAEGGACIMYTHFASGFVHDGGLDPRFTELVTRLAGKNGSFVPVLDAARPSRRHPRCPHDHV